MRPIRRVLLVLFPLLAVTLTAFGAISPEVAVSAPVYGQSPFAQIRLHTATDGSGYLAVWSDMRDDFQALVAARISLEGEVLDPTGLVIASGTSIDKLRVVWNGSSYVVVWSNLAGTNEIRLARIDRDGNIVTLPRTVIADAVLGDVAVNGACTLIVYEPAPTASANEIRAALLDSDANVIHDAQLAAPTKERYDIAAAAHGSGFVAMWNWNHLPVVGVEGARIGANGEPLDAEPRQIVDGAYTPVLASDGTNLVLVARVSFPDHLAWSSFAVSGDLLQVGARIELPDSTSIANPVLAWIGDRYVLLADSTVGPRLELMHLDRFGRPLTSVNTAPFGRQAIPAALAAATDGDDVLLTWLEARTTQDGTALQVVGRLFSATALTARTPGAYIAVTANHQLDPAVATGASMTLVAWREPDGIYAARIRNGQSLDGRGVLLDSGRSGAPRVVFDGTQFVIAWYASERASVRVRFLSPQNGLLPETLETSGMVHSPAIALASGRGKTLLGWTNADDRIAAQPIDAASRAFSAPRLLVSPGGSRAEGAVASWNGSEFLVAWDETEVRAMFPFPYYTFAHLRVQGARLSAELALRNPEPIVLGDATTGQDRVQAIASNGKEWLVIWNNDDVVRARRVKSDGSVDGPVDGAVVGTGTSPYGAGTTSSAAWDGTRYAIAWKATDARRTISLAYLNSLDPIVASAPLAITPTDTSQAQIALTSPSFLQVALVYGRYAPEEEYGGVSRVFLRTIAAPMKMRAVR